MRHRLGSRRPRHLPPSFQHTFPRVVRVPTRLSQGHDTPRSRPAARAPSRHDRTSTGARRRSVVLADGTLGISFGRRPQPPQLSGAVAAGWRASRLASDGKPPGVTPDRAASDEDPGFLTSGSGWERVDPRTGRSAGGIRPPSLRAPGPFPNRRPRAPRSRRPCRVPARPAPFDARLFMVLFAASQCSMYFFAGTRLIASAITSSARSSNLLEPHAGLAHVELLAGLGPGFSKPVRDVANRRRRT